MPAISDPVGPGAKLRYSIPMSEPKSKASDNIDFAPQSSEASAAEYDAWKVEKITKAIKQCEDRSSMIPATDVWERFGFER